MVVSYDVIMGHQDKMQMEHGNVIVILAMPGMIVLNFVPMLVAVLTVLVIVAAMASEGNFVKDEVVQDAA